MSNDKANANYEAAKKAEREKRAPKSNEGRDSKKQSGQQHGTHRQGPRK